MINTREYRDMKIEIEKREAEDSEPTYKVRGYASTFEPYMLFEDEEGVKYYEKILPTAFDDADMTDVVLRIDHEGKVYARTSAGDLTLGTDAHGLWQEADLSKTASGRSLFEDIAAGHYPKMSFAFIVDEDSYDKNSHTRTISRIGKVFDVSPVSWPANPGTELNVATRSYFDGVIKEERAERLAEEARKMKLEILTLVLNKILEPNEDGN